MLLWKISDYHFLLTIDLFPLTVLTHNARIFSPNGLTSEDYDREIIPCVSVVVTRAAVFPKTANKSAEI